MGIKAKTLGCKLCPAGGNLVPLLFRNRFEALLHLERFFGAIDLPLIRALALKCVHGTLEFSLGQLGFLARQSSSLYQACLFHAQLIELRVNLGNPLGKNVHLLDKIGLVEFSQNVAILDLGAGDNMARYFDHDRRNLHGHVGRVHRGSGPEPGPLPAHGNLDDVHDLDPSHRRWLIRHLRPGLGLQQYGKDSAGDRQQSHGHHHLRDDGHQDVALISHAAAFSASQTPKPYTLCRHTR